MKHDSCSSHPARMLTHLDERQSTEALDLTHLRSRGLNGSKSSGSKCILALPADCICHLQTTDIVACSVGLAVVESHRHTGFKRACEGAAVVKGVLRVERAHADAAACGAGERIVTGIAAHIEGGFHLRLQEPVGPSGVVVAVARAAGDALEAVVLRKGAANWTQMSAAESNKIHQ